jgi:hypothetical protein
MWRNLAATRNSEVAKQEKSCWVCAERIAGKGGRERDRDAERGGSRGRRMKKLGDYPNNCEVLTEAVDYALAPGRR